MASKSKKKLHLKPNALDLAINRELCLYGSKGNRALQEHRLFYAQAPKVASLVLHRINRQ